MVGVGYLHVTATAAVVIVFAIAIIAVVVVITASLIGGVVGVGVVVTEIVGGGRRTFGGMWLRSARTDPVSVYSHIRIQ